MNLKQSDFPIQTNKQTNNVLLVVPPRTSKDHNLIVVYYQKEGFLADYSVKNEHRVYTREHTRNFRVVEPRKKSEILVCE